MNLKEGKEEQNEKNYIKYYNFNFHKKLKENEILISFSRIHI